MLTCLILEVGTVVRRFLAMPRLLKPWFCPRQAREGKMGSWQLSVGWRERVGERVGECVGCVQVVVRWYLEELWVEVQINMLQIGER